MREVEEDLTIKTFGDMKGETIVGIENKDNRELIFSLPNGDRYKLYHNQDCCESVMIEDIIGELDDLIGSPLLMAEEVFGETGEGGIGDHYTWTFYKFATIKGYVTIRWYGSSNGCYSESVDWEKLQ